MAQYDDLNTRQIWIVGIASAVLTGVSILAVQVLYYAFQTQHEASMSQQSEYVQSVSYIAGQQERLTKYGRDKDTGAIHIPIQQAFDLIIPPSTNN
jgi:hypothetical protein